MKMGNLISYTLLFLSWIAFVHSKCSDGLDERTCDPDGNYEVKQCDNSWICICVDRITGVEIPGTLRMPDSEPLDCQALQPGTQVTSAASSTTQSTTPPTATQRIASPPTTQTPSSATPELQLNFDENDICYKQNKKTYDYWNEKMKSYEEQVQRWQQSMTDYENYLKSLETDET